VSQICRRTTVSVSESTTRLVRKLAPTVEVIWAGLKAPLQYRVTSDVFPTPWEPRMTILASSDDIVSGSASALPLSGSNRASRPNHDGGGLPEAWGKRCGSACLVEKGPSVLLPAGFPLSGCGDDVARACSPAGKTAASARIFSYDCNADGLVVAITLSCNQI